MFSVNKKKIKKIFLLIGILLLVIQFFPAPKNNLDSSITPKHFAAMYQVPDTVLQILERSCFDCHSNNTVYPWYYRLQPAGWWLKHHVDEGKGGLNFSEYGNMSVEDQDHMLEELGEAVSEGWMPLNSYLWIHKNASLTPEQQMLIKKWTEETRAKHIY